METDVKILGGLTVTIKFTVAPADRSVGLMSDYVEDWHISAINHRNCKKPPEWLYNRIEAKKGEEDRIMKALYATLDKGCRDYDGYDDY